MALQNPLLPVPQESVGSLPPAPTAGLTTADLARLRHSLDSSVSDNTRAMYNSAWRGFEAWTQARGALSLPASPSIVAAYLACLAEELRLSVATVRLHKAALAAIHKASGHEDPTDNEGVRRIMKGIAQAHGKGQKQARPLTAETLAAVKATAKSRRSLEDGKRQESTERASWRGRVDVALLATLRDGLLRRSEAAALTWGDVEFRDNGSALLQLRRSKTDQEAEGVTLYIGTEASQALAGHQARDRAAGPQYKNFRDDRPTHRQSGQGGCKGRRPGRRFHRPLGESRHGPGPGEKRRGTASPDDRGPVEKLKNAGEVHRKTGGGPGCRGQVLPRKRNLEPTRSFDLEDRTVALGLAQRTLKNLKYIKKAAEAAEDVHLITDLTNSLLGLVIVPKAEYEGAELWNVTLKELEKNKWPQWKITKDELGAAIEKYWTPTKDLGRLVAHLRNAAAHGRFEYTGEPNSLKLSKVTLVVRDKPGKNKPVNWEAEIGGEDLYKFCTLLTKHIENRLG